MNISLIKGPLAVDIGVPLEVSYHPLYNPNKDWGSVGVIYRVYQLGIFQFLSSSLYSRCVS